MKSGNIMDITIWPAILILLFGVLFKLIDNDFTTWFAFTFLCMVGIARASVNWRSRK